MAKSFEVESMGVLMPKPVEIAELRAGEVGFFAATIKNVGDTKIGDTVTDDSASGAFRACPALKTSSRWSSPASTRSTRTSTRCLRDALEKLRLNDSSFFFEPESSVALGFGFRCGFLGLLHMEIIQERLEREYELDLITTAPGVRYHITLTDGTVARSGQSFAMARADQHREDPRAHHHRQNSHQRGICRRHSQVGGGEARVGR